MLLFYLWGLLYYSQLTRLVWFSTKSSNPKHAGTSSLNTLPAVSFPANMLQGEHSAHGFGYLLTRSWAKDSQQLAMLRQFLGGKKPTESASWADCCFLLGGFNPWKILVSWDDYSQYMEKMVPNHQPVSVWTPAI
jgi:hypothetical protein